MDFDYTDDQKALKEEARRFLTAVSPITVARKVLDNPADGYDQPLWERIVEQGWCGAAIPESYGGLGMGYVELCALAEELGRAVAPVPFASAIYQFAEGLLVAGSEEQKLALLPQVAAGEIVGTLAISEGPGIADPARLVVRVAGGKLSGTKIPVIDGLAANRAIVLAAGEGGAGLYLVDLEGPGVARECVSTIDPTRGAAKLTFTDAPAELLGAAGQGMELLARIQDRAAVLVAFEQLGGADRALEMARDYALERYAFGRPIGAYQAIKHKLADVYIRNEVARANAYYGAWALSTDDAELPLAAAAARVSACTAYWQASKEMIQTFGGIGFTWEADCHFFYRRAKHLGLALGSQREWKRRLADQLEAKVALEEAEKELTMDFEDSPREAAYRATVRAWISANAPDVSRLSPEESRAWHPAHKELARQWQVTKAEAGYACISWPKEWGGAGGDVIEETIFLQEEQRAGLQFMYFTTGLKMLLPAIMEHNKDDLSRSLVPPAVRGDTIWCQLFSEPSSGSDSAGARCMAVRDGDEWVINGQKVWNSGAFHADFGMLVTRSNPDLPKHKGLTVFWLDMKTPGVEVRPIRMMSGDNELNEVFFTDVRIPATQMVGGEGDGWKVILTTLTNERAAVGSGTGLNWRDVVKLAREVPSFDGEMAMADPAFREWLADYYVGSEAIRLLSYRTLTALSRGQVPDGGGTKVLWANQTQEMTSQALDILDRYGLIEDPAIASAGGAFQHRFLWAPGLRLGGGSDEIMKNIIAERTLGLPGDIRVDKGIPFREIPNGR